MRTLLWSYLGWRRFPRDMSAFEVRHFFSFSLADRRELRIRYPRRLRLGAALQLGFVRMSGTTLDVVDYVPHAVLRHVANALALPAPDIATLRALYRREKTLFAHQAWAWNFAGFHWVETIDVTAVIDALVAGTAVTLDRHRLARQGRESLYARRCLIPRERDIEDWVRRTIQLVEHEDCRYLDTVVYTRQRDAWLPGLLRETLPSPMTILEWIRRPARKRSKKTLSEETQKLLAVRALCPPALAARIPVERLRAYARRMQRRRPIKVREIAEPRRTLEIGALLAVLATRQSDTVLRLYEMRIGEIWRWAHALVRPVPRPRVPEDIVTELASAMDNAVLSDAEFRERSRDLLKPWKPGAGQQRFTRAAQVRERLAANARRIRPLLKGLVELGLEGVPGDPIIKALGELRECYREGWADLYDCATAPPGYGWNALIHSPDRELAFRAYEAATLWAVRRGLRNGSLWLEHAERYAGRHRLLLPPARWSAARDAFLERRSLPRTADRFLERLTDQVHAGLCAVNEAVTAGELEIWEDGHLHFAHMRDDPRVTVEPSDADQLRRRLYARVPRVQLPELLMAVDSETHFSWELLGRAPSAPEELIPLYAAILVGAMGLDHTDVAMMIPGVRLSAIRRASGLLQHERGLRRANDGVVEFLLRQPLSNEWGHGYEASSDLMSLDVSRHLWTARVDPKRRRHAIGTYTHVLDRWGIVYDQPLLLATRQAGAAIEGAIRQSITCLARLAVDTHGYTDFAMLIAKLLGFDLCPRLYSMHDRHLHVPRGFDVPGALVNLVRQDVPLVPIHAGWDQLLHVAATIEEGWRSATDVLEQFGSAARGDLTYRAGSAAGQLQRTVYLCDYFTLPDFRRPLHHVLERGESVHALQRQICAQPLPSRRGRNAEELIATSGALTLVTNCVMAWNTQRLQRAVEREAERTATRLSIDALKHIGPVAHRHINFRGTYRFPIDRYAGRLMQSAA